MGRITDREPCSDDEEWKHITDANERRKVQNRNNQRALRRRRLQLRQQEQVPARMMRTIWPVLQPKQQPQPNENDPPHISSEPQGSEPQSDNLCENIVLTENTLKSSLFGIHEMSASNLDMDARRVFHYASTWLWPHLGQKVLDTNETIAAAMTRLALSHPLTMDTFVWIAAGSLEMHGHNPATQRVLLKHQMRAIRTIRDSIQSNNISDELIHAVHALSVMETPTGALKTWEEVIYGPEPSPFGDFDPPLASLGYILRISQMKVSHQHVEIAARLLRSRGGLEGMTVVEFAYPMQVLDLVRSSKAVSLPSFNLCKPYKQMLDTQMPLYRHEHRAWFQHPYPVSLDFNLLLLDFRALLRQLDLSATPGSTEVTTETLIAWRNINQHRLLSLPHDQDHLFRLVTLIFSFNVTFPVPMRNVIEKLTRELVHHLRCTLESSEDLLWATVIAALTRPDDEIQHFLLETARNLTAALNINTWYDFKNVLVKYLWLDGACEVGGFRFWIQISRSQSDCPEASGYRSNDSPGMLDDFDDLDLSDD